MDEKNMNKVLVEESPKKLEITEKEVNEDGASLTSPDRLRDNSNLRVKAEMARELIEKGFSVVSVTHILHMEPWETGCLFW